MKINRPNDLKICSGTWINCSIRMINCSKKLKIWWDNLVNRLNDFVNGSNEIKIRLYEIRNLTDESINGSDALRERERERERERQRQREIFKCNIIICRVCVIRITFLLLQYLHEFQWRNCTKYWRTVFNPTIRHDKSLKSY